MAKTQQQIVDEANIAGQKASEVTGIDFTEGTIDTYFPRAVDKPTEPLPSTNNVGLPPVEPIETETTEEIQARKTKMAQGEIDALNKVYQDKIADQRVVNEGENRRTSSINTLTGLSGSTEAGVQAKKTEDLGNKEIEAINNQKALQMAQIFTKISESSIEEARYQREEARLDTQTAQANRLARIDEARADLSLLGAGTTATLEGLRNSMTPEQYEGMITNVGGEAMANAILFESRPKEQVEDMKFLDSGLIQITTMPDGTRKTEFISYGDLGMDTPEDINNVKSVQKLDNGQVMIINEDGTYKTVGNILKDLSSDNLDELNDFEIDPASKSILAQTGLSQNAFLALTGQLSKLPRDKDTRTKANMEMQKWAIDNDIDTSIFVAEYEAQTDIVKQYTKRAAAVDLRGEDIMLSLNMLKDITKEAQFGDLKIKNVAKLWAGRQVNDPVAQQYAYNLEDLRSAVAGFFAVQEGRNMTTVEDGRNAEELIANGLATGSIQGLVDTIETVKKRTTAISNQAARNAQGSIWEMFGVTKPGGEGEETQTGMTGTLPDGTQVTKKADGSITDAMGNKYNEDGNKI